jgi:cell wall-associated NlpC family hydrolase
MNAADVSQYVGKQYGEGGSGPDVYNCWGLLRYIEFKHFNRLLPEIPIGDAVAIRAIHAESEQRGLYRPVKHPQHGDAVLLRGGDCPHVGVWLDLDGGGVLHAMFGYGVIWTRKKDLNYMGFGRVTYYRIEDARSFCSPQGSVQADS